MRVVRPLFKKFGCDTYAHVCTLTPLQQARSLGLAEPFSSTVYLVSIHGKTPRTGVLIVDFC